MRRTLVSLTPLTAAIVRLLQCVASPGGSWSVISTMRSTTLQRQGWDARWARLVAQQPVHAVSAGWILVLPHFS
ncbi:hypothetical protein ACHMW5_10890 [Azospirillum melinis]|uniref:hypothetical protein n=1 Tax=Azospirillum melinis TaxID=328839 RepID=UPI0037583394